MVGSKLKELRYQHKYTISQLCDMLSLNPNTYAKYERDERDVSTDTLSKLADFYRVSTDYLLGRDTSEPAPLDQYASSVNMSELEREIVDGYFQLDAKTRDVFMDMLEAAVKNVQSGHGVPEQEENDTAQDEEVVYAVARGGNGGRIKLKKRPGAGSILDKPTYKGGSL